MISETLLDFASTAAMLGLSVLAIALVLSVPRTSASRFLLGYLVCVALDSLVGLLLLGWQPSLSPAAVRWLHVVNVPAAYLYGLLLYGYVVALTSPPRGWQRRDRWHLLPFGIALSFSVANALFGLDHTHAGNLAFLLSYHAWVLFGLAYLGLAVQRIYRSRPALERRLADESALRLTWLRALITWLAVSWIGMTIDRFATLAGRPMHGWAALLLDVAGYASLLVLASFGLRQPVLAQSESGDDAAADPATKPYARSALSVAQCVEMANELAGLMESGSLYVDAQLDLRTLSRRSGWPPNYVSQALNQGRGQNFFEFVNGFRVSAAARYLANPDDARTILDIALACGFGSKSTFNAVFKRLTGHTPSAYRRSRGAPADESVA